MAVHEDEEQDDYAPGDADSPGAAVNEKIKLRFEIIYMYLYVITRYGGLFML